MKDFKEIIYESYYTKHNRNLYGENDLGKISAKFPLWKYHFTKFLPANKDANILDIGCGDGSFVHWLHSLGYSNTKGIDLSEEQIAEGRKLGIQNIFCADLNVFLKSADIKYDLIIARDVIEHFTRNEVFSILSFINENLKGEGKLLIQVPNGEGLFYTSIFYGDYTHEMAYTAKSISQVALNTGFSSSVCYPLTPAPVSATSFIRHWLWRFKVSRLRFWKMVETGSSSGIFTQNLIAVLVK